MRSNEVDGLVLRPAVASDEDAILALAARTLGWDESDRFAALFRWKHDENAFGPSPRWVATDGDRVVGFRVFLPWRFRHPSGEVVRAVRAVDTATDPDHQGRGIFRNLTMRAVAELTDDGVGFVFNTPNEKSRPGYLKMGWEELGRPGFGMVPARPTALARMARARVPAELWSQPSSVGSGAAGTFADESATATLLASMAPARGLTTDLTPAVLRWRYGHPPLHYRVITPPGGLTEGAAVFRLRRRGPALEAAVVELLVPGDDPAVRRRLVRAVAKRAGADYVLVAAEQRVDPTPLLRLTPLSPLVTWRALASTTNPGLAGFRFSLGDLELF